MLRNRKATGVAVIGSNSFMISNSSVKMRETLGLMAFDKENTITTTNVTTTTIDITPQKVDKVTSVPAFAPVPEPDNSFAHQESNSVSNSIITEQPSQQSSNSESNALEYPADMTGFLNGLSEGLSNIVRDVKTSRFAADVKMDANTIWKSTKGVVARLVIEPLRSMEEDDSEEQSEIRRQKEYDRAEAATKVRMPSAWGDGSKKHEESGDLSMSSIQGSLFGGIDNFNSSNRRRRSAEMGAKKLAKTPRKKQTKTDQNKDKADQGGDSAKAELGSAIDLRKLSKAKKVQVFHGPGAAIMVVGARRLVVIEARPTIKEPHQGVVVWMSTLENVASIALEIQPSESSEVSVALKVEVKEGEDHVFVMGVRDSTSLVQSIYARLNGETPPSLPKPAVPTGSNSDDSVANEAACKIAANNAEGSGGVEGGGCGSVSSSMQPPMTPQSRSNKGERVKSSSKKSSRKHRSHRKKQASVGGVSYPTASPKTIPNGATVSSSPSAFASPQSVSNKANTMLSPLRIMLSPTGRGNDMSLEVISISSPRGTLSMGPPQISSQASPTSSPLKSLATHFDNVSSSPGNKCTTIAQTATAGQTTAISSVASAGSSNNAAPCTASTPAAPITTTTTASAATVSSDSESSSQALPMKYRMMLKNGVPEMAVRNKARAEMNLNETEIEKLFSENTPLPKATSSEPSSLPPVSTIPPITERVNEKDKAEVAALSEEETASVSKYKMMLKAGVPEQAVVQKMQKESMSDKLIQAVCKSFQPKVNNSKSVAKVEMNAEEEKQTRKYRVMLKAGVPADAVRHKMKKDGVEDKLISIVLGEDSTGTESENKLKKKKEVEVLSEEEEAKVAKFKSMLKAGVPAMAVRHKMLKELGENQRLIDSVCGYENVDTGGTEKWTGREGDDNSNSVLKTATKPKNQSKLLTLHWTPLGISEEQLESSVWAQARPKNDVNGSKSNIMGGPTIVLSPEMQRLELLFSKKPAKSMQTPHKDGESGAATKKPKKKASCLDNTRRQNLSIALKNFKNIAAFDIGTAVSQLNVEAFTAEQLTRLDEMLPNDTEIKSVERHLKDLEKEMKKQESQLPEGEKLAKTAVDCLEPAEAFVLGFSKVERAKPKLAVLAQMRSLTPQVEELLADFSTLGSACHQASTSTRLSSLLLEVLAVGNIMNEGTEKGGAKGITVDSLLKLTNTRSVCKSMTVLDYIVDSLLVKQRKFNADTDPSVEDILDDAPKRGEHDLEEGPASILVFSQDLPQLNDACRLPLGELLQQVTTMKKALALAEREYEKMKVEVEKAPSPPVLNKADRKENLKSASEKSVSSEAKKSDDPRASLMAMLRQRAGERDEEVSDQAKPVKEKEEDLHLGGRNLEASMRDEAEACKSVKEVSDAAGLRASSFLASDPKAGLMAALKARSATENLTATETVTAPDMQPEAKVNNRDQLVKAVKSLAEFIEYAQVKLQQVEAAGLLCKEQAENMTKFFGEPGTDAGHILSCLKQFSEMTLQSKDKAIAKKLDEERRERIAAKETLNASMMTPAGKLNRSMSMVATAAAATPTTTSLQKTRPNIPPQRDIDPKAGLMNEIRKANELRLERSLSTL